jgi:uncharacterized protein
MDLREKSQYLQEQLGLLDSLLVAYSGGTDSAFLAYMAHQALGARMLAVIADSPSLPRKELAAALRFAQEHGIPVRVLQTHEMERPEYIRNDSQRCFQCKDELFTQMKAARVELGFAYLAYGMNVDDRGEFRPGQRAASLHGALAPLAEAELCKLEIRELAREAGLMLADKPASACLSSRLEYGRPVTTEALAQIEEAEDALHAMGFARIRVRHHGELARVEIAREEMAQALTMGTLDAMTAVLRRLGFLYVTLDMEGYRSGSLNQMLPASAIAAAK